MAAFWAAESFRMGKYILSLLNTETRYLDTDADWSVINPGAFVNLLINPVSQGVEYFQREGQQVKAVGIHVRLQLQNNSDENTSTPITLYVIQQRVPDLQSGSPVPPNVDDILQDEGLRSLDYLNPLLMGNQFIIHHRSVHALPKDGDKGSVKFVEEFIQLKDKHIETAWLTDTGTAITKNAFWVLALANASTDSVDVRARCRYSYVSN